MAAKKAVLEFKSHCICCNLESIFQLLIFLYICRIFAPLLQFQQSSIACLVKVVQIFAKMVSLNLNRKFKSSKLKVRLFDDVIFFNLT